MKKFIAGIGAKLEAVVMLLIALCLGLFLNGLIWPNLFVIAIGILFVVVFGCIIAGMVFVLKENRMSTIWVVPVAMVFVIPAFWYFFHK